MMTKGPVNSGRSGAPRGVASIRRSAALAVLALALGFGVLPAAAQETMPAEAGPAPPAGRFTMVPAEGGFVRLDTTTGLVSHCRRETSEPSASWRCAAIPEDVLNTPDRVSELGEEVEALGREIAALRMRLDALDRRETAAKPAPAPPPRLQDDEEMEKALDFSEELMRRFFGLVQEMKRAPDEDRT